MSDTPIYDQVSAEHREANAAGDLAEGRALVAAIHEGKREARLEALREGRRIRPGVRHLAVLFGVFR